MPRATLILLAALLTAACGVEPSQAAGALGPAARGSKEPARAIKHDTAKRTIVDKGAAADSRMGDKAVLDNGSGMMKPTKGDQAVVLDNGSGMLKAAEGDQAVVLDNGSGMLKTGAKTPKP